MDSSKIKSLPAIVAEHIYSPQLSDHYQKIMVDFSDTAIEQVIKLIWKVYQKESSLQDFFAQVNNLNLPKFKEKVFPEILRYDFFFIADYLNIKIVDWLNFLSPQDLKDLKIVKLSEWLKTYFENQGETESTRKSRFTKILTDFFSGLKDEEGTKEILTLEEKSGGVELNEADAKKIVDDFKKRVAEAWNNNEIFTAQEVTKPVVSATLISAPSKPDFVQQQKTSLANQTVVPRSVSVVEVTPFVSAVKMYEENAAVIIKKSGLTVPDDLQNRFKTLLISGLKEVRKITEVKERLMADIKIGGMGLSPEDTENILKLVEQGKKEVVQNKVVVPAVNSIEEIKKPVFEKILNAKQEEVKTPSVPVKPVAPPIAQAPQIKPAEKREEKPFIAKPFKIEPVQTKTSADIKTGQSPALKIITPERQSTRIEPTPIPLKVRPPVTDAIPTTPGGRAKVEDVVFRTRLIGPLEELSGMELLDFHRLSPKPKVAVDKIHSKIELLAKEGYAKSVQGIQAWQKSPVNQLYVTILNDGIKKGVPVKQVIEERLKAGQPSLTIEEFQEIMGLNRSVHF